MNKQENRQNSNLKNVTYQKDGTGRDFYISFNNGGVQKDQHFVTGGYERGLFPWKRQYAGNLLPARAKMTHYNQNGGGRDGYIGCDAGGLSIMDMRHTRSGRNTFLGSLRAYDKRPTRCSTMYNQSPQHPPYVQQKMGKQVLQEYRIRINSMYQRDCVDRLSMKKQSSDPYEEFRQHTGENYK